MSSKRLLIKEKSEEGSEGNIYGHTRKFMIMWAVWHERSFSHVFRGVFLG